MESNESSRTQRRHLVYGCICRSFKTTLAELFFAAKVNTAMSIRRCGRSTLVFYNSCHRNLQLGNITNLIMFLNLYTSVNQPKKGANEEKLWNHYCYIAFYVWNKLAIWIWGISRIFIVVLGASYHWPNTLKQTRKSNKKNNLFIIPINRLLCFKYVYYPRLFLGRFLSECN